jgi:hypothetical protein
MQWRTPGRFILIWLAAACGRVIADIEQAETPVPVIPTTVAISTPLPGNLDSVTFIEDDRRYTIDQLLPRDGIRPFYNPTFAAPENAGYDPDELVMGLEINGDARAYAVGILRSREMVNDVVGGTPVLVTW